MSDFKQAQQRGFGRRILTDSTAVFRLRDIEAQLSKEQGRGGQPPPTPRQPPPTPPPIPTPAPEAAKPSSGTEPLVDLSALDETSNTDLLTGKVSAARAKQVVFFASKGGVGATSLSVHVAGALTALGNRVCVVDMDLQMGGTAFALGVETTRSLANLAQAVQKGPEAVADFPIAQHMSSGVYILDQPDLAEVAQVGADGLPNVLNTLSQLFDYVLIDGLRDFGDHALVTMDEADQIVLVTNDDVPSLRCGIRALDLFRRLGYPAERVKLLLNKNSDRDPSFLQAVEAAFGRRIDWWIPQIDALEQCVNDGMLLSSVEPGAAGNLIFENLARTLAGLPIIEPSKRSFFSRLFSRRS